MKEIYREIPGYEGLYEASNMGRVKSIRYSKERVMKQQLNATGYLYITLYGRRKRTTHRVHRIIASIFVENPNNYPLVLHRDDDKKNNLAENLYWGTYSDNMRDRDINGIGANKGTDNGCSVLTEVDVLKIRNIYPGMSQKEIASIYGVTRSTIGHIVRGDTWAHI